MILACVINTRQLSDVTTSPRIVHHATVSFRTGLLNLLQFHAHGCVASGSQFLFFATVRRVLSHLFICANH